MPITDGEWNSIRTLVERVSAEVAGNKNFFTTGHVIKRDEDNMLIWIEEFGDQPIPMAVFEYEVKYYDTKADGSMEQKKAKVKPLIPKIGDTVFVAREMGTRRLPRCLGVVRGKGWIVPESE